jgi:uracil-DNA glycosylase
MRERDALRALASATRAHLEWLRESGVETVETVALTPAATADEAASDARAAALAPPPGEGAAMAEQSVAAATASSDDLFLPPEVRGATSLAGLREAIGDCTRCKLAPHRTNLVFGVGNPDADLVFVGEAPGRDEDVRGEPFVGRAGQLLTEIITKGMKLRREDVYIANILKCRPPQNRNPEPDEIASCEPFLIRQLALIRPKVIVALGTFAAQTLLKSRTPITRLRGVWTEYHGIPLMPTFHPAYLLRNPGEKRVVWQDIQQVMKALGLPV